MLLLFRKERKTMSPCSREAMKVQAMTPRPIGPIVWYICALCKRELPPLDPLAGKREGLQKSSVVRELPSESSNYILAQGFPVDHLSFLTLQFGCFPIFVGFPCFGRLICYLLAANDLREKMPIFCSHPFCLWP